MIIGLLLAGMLVGIGGAMIALLAGQSVWVALALYAGGGIVATLMGAAVAGLCAAVTSHAPQRPITTAGRG